MSHLRHIPQSSFVKGIWRNGRGVSWDIASDQPALPAGDFGWRLALAQIAVSGPFSMYGAVDRFFTLLEGDGDGVDLTLENGTSFAVHQRFVPHHFPCDVATDCTLRGRSSRVLNLFTARHLFKANVTVMQVNGVVSLPDSASLLFALEGQIHVGDLILQQGDAAEIRGTHTASGDRAMLYVASFED